jgi:hypothetical protein
MDLKGHPLISDVLPSSTERFIPSILSTATMVHLRESRLINILDNELELSAPGGEDPWTVPLTNCKLFPAIPSLIKGGQEIMRETLSPLNVELVSFTKLNGEIVSKVDFETA